MRMFQQMPGTVGGRGNVIEITVPSYEHLGEHDRFYWDAIVGRLLTAYRSMRRHGLSARQARTTMWTIVFAIEMGSKTGEGPTRFLSVDQQAMLKELAQ